jgi:hypothetical protein
MAARKSNRSGQSAVSEKETQRLQQAARRAPFVLRLTRLRRTEPPVLIIKERIELDDRDDVEGLTNPRSKTVDRGMIHGEAVRACLPVLKRLLERVTDEAGIPLGLETFMTQEGLKQTDLNLPLDEGAGARLSLFFKLQSRVQDIDRVELIGRRISRFSREEAVYWLSNVTAADETLRAWSISGLRTMLAGEAGDKRIREQLDRLRARG